MFDLAQWRARVTELLADFRQHPRQAVGTTLLGFLSTMAFLPLVEALARGDGVGMGLALGGLGIAANVGANLLAELVLRLQQAPEEDRERLLVEALADSSDLRTAVDDLLTQLDVLDQAATGLSDADRTWFAQTLQENLAAFPASFSQARQTILTIDASVHDRHDVHIRAGGEVAYANQGPAMVDKRRTIYAGTYVEQHTGPASPPAAADLADRWATYCDLVTQRHCYLNLQGVGADPELRVQLEPIYVALKTTEPVEERTQPGQAREVSPEWLVAEGRLARPLTVAAAFGRHERLIITGDPGSGKSTFLSHLALRFARAWRAQDPAPLRETLGWEGPALLPVYLPLRAFAGTLPARTPDETAEYPPALLLRYLQNSLKNHQLEDLAPALLALLAEGRCLLLLDGLDEVPTDAQRAAVRRAVESFLGRHSGNRAVVTCRTLAYRDATVLGGTFHRVTLAPFDDDDQASFVQGWYGQVPASRDETTVQRAQGLLRAIRASERLRDLAGNPLLLTVMALVHYKHVHLPERRVELYDRCIEVLLENWEGARRGAVGGGLSDALGLPELKDRATKLDLLCPIAYQMHRQGWSDAARRDILPLVQPVLTSLAGDERAGRQKARAFLDFLVGRSGLLQERDVGRFNFPHRSFQEYLTALAIAGEDFLAEAFDRRADPNWREVILLAVGYLTVSRQVHRARDLVRCLAEETEGEDQQRSLVLAGQCLLDAGRVVMERERGGAELWGQVAQGLTEVATAGVLDAAARAEAGRVLGWLGDPRPDVACNVPHMIDIPAGTFVMGSKEDNVLARDNEYPQHEVTLLAYRIGKYPVTVGQYRRFVEAGGYAERKHWTAAGWAWREEQGLERPALWDDPRWTIPNHPVIGVSWYEAAAYCRWLSEDAGRAFRLPTEAEWERAARGSHGREWPWGNEWEKGRSNTEGIVGSTTAVGLFPGDESPYGLLDVAGNVLEWCGSLFRDYPFRVDDVVAADQVDGGSRVVVRGGSWDSNQRGARCANRNRSQPVNRDDNLGFRVAE